MQNNQKINNTRFMTFLIGLSIFVNALGMFSTIGNGGADSLYAVIAKHIVLSHDWINLTFLNHAWLDKPHFPFWMTALSYEIFGINSFAYMLPGFLFSLLGAFYTYRLTKKIYSHEIALLSVLIYVSSLYLMLSNIHVEAEAYLLGTLIPACYYWLCYDAENSPSINILTLLKGTIFTAMAIMTKGIFVLLPILSGLIAITFHKIGFTKTLRQFFGFKWLLALFLSLLFISPELISLFLQFDMHPNLVVFGHTHVSGIKFFFWDSQWGRFFETGPITRNAHPHQIYFSHYFYYIGVLIWAFLPWCILFIASFFSKNHFNTKANSRGYIYLLGSFFPMFIVFSITQFQFDHYFNIITPFAAMIVAEYIYYSMINKSHDKLICRTQGVISILLCCTAIILSLAILHHWPLNTLPVPGIVILKRLLIAVIAIAFITAAYIIIKFNKLQIKTAIIFSVISVNIAFVFVTNVNEIVSRIYDRGYIISNYLRDKPQYLIVDHVGSTYLEFYSGKNYILARSADEIKKITQQHLPYYLVVSDDQWATVKRNIIAACKKNNDTTPKMELLYQFHSIHPGVFSHELSVLINPKKRAESIERDNLVLATFH